jgi:uridine kinase
MNNMASIESKKPLIVGIAGGTCSGKTTLTRSIAERFTHDVAVLFHDNYYKPHDDIPFEERVNLNYDCPEAYDTDLFIAQLEKLSAGQAIDCPVYDYKIHTRKSDTTLIEPNKIIIIDGILIFADERLRGMIDIKIYVDTDADERLIRRLLRDVNERGRDIGTITSQYLDTVKPMHRQYVEPTKRYADIILNGGRNIVALDFITKHIEAYLLAK